MSSCAAVVHDLPNNISFEEWNTAYAYDLCSSILSTSSPKNWPQIKTKLNRD